MKKSTADTSWNLDKIISALDDFDWATVKEISKKTGIARSTTQRILEKSSEDVESRYIALGTRGRPVKQYRKITEIRTVTEIRSKIDLVKTLSNKQDSTDLNNYGFSEQLRKKIASVVESSLEHSKNNLDEISLPETIKLVERKLRRDTRVTGKLSDLGLSEEKENKLLEKLAWNLIRMYFES